jgi:TonB family protein
VLHFFILTVFDTIPLISKEIPQRNLYMVDLMPLPIERPAPQEEEATVPKQATEVKKEEVKKEEPKKEEVKKEEVKKEEPKKERVKEEAQKDTVVLKDPGKQQGTQEKTKKESTEKPTVNDEQQRLVAIKEIEQKVAGRATDDVPMVTNAEIDQYKWMIQERVKRFWVIPDTLSESDLGAVIIIEIDTSGNVKKSRFEQSSGNLVFDQAAIRAISKATPFPSPPGKISMEFGLRFP